MIAQVFQHVPFEDIGSIRGWLDQREAEIRYTRFFAGDNPPNIEFSFRIFRVCVLFDL